MVVWGWDVRFCSFEFHFIRLRLMTEMRVLLNRSDYHLSLYSQTDKKDDNDYYNCKGIVNSNAIS